MNNSRVKIFKVFQGRAVKTRVGVDVDRREMVAAHGKNRRILGIRERGRIIENYTKNNSPLSLE